MERPFLASKWKPTKPFQPGENGYTEEKVAELSVELSTNTKRIQCRPYDAATWIQRAHTLTALRYPELAVGDGLKARLLCQEMLATLQTNSLPNYRLGAHAGFWMRHEDPEDEYYDVPAGLIGNIDRDLDKEHDAQVITFEALLYKADEIIGENLEYYPNAQIGSFSPQAYPWLQEKHTWRTPEVLEQINRDFSSSADSAACTAKRNAFGGGADGINVLGVFATRDLQKGETVLVDHSKIFGCHGPSQADLDRGKYHRESEYGLSNLHRTYGCEDALHPNAEDDDVEHDLRWIRDRAGEEAPHALMTTRFFLSCVQDGVDHPLDHSNIARLTPHYRDGVTRNLYFENDFHIFNEALQQFGIDIFANHNFDTWVVFTVDARGTNNAWSNLTATCLHPLFALINHSCDPNLSWHTHANHRSMHLEARRPINKGEQLFISYDGFSNATVRERRQRMLQWLDHECNCARCVREDQLAKDIEAYYQQYLKDVPELQDFPARATLGAWNLARPWDYSAPAELPEDAVEGGKWETAKKRTRRFKAREAAAQAQKQKQKHKHKHKSGGGRARGRKEGKLNRKDMTSVGWLDRALA